MQCRNRRGVGRNVRELGLALGLLCLVITSPALAELAVGLTEGLTLTHDAELRTYTVLVPSAAGALPRPLVVDLHGAGSNFDQQRGLSGWNTLAEVEGFLVAWPNGLYNTWNGVTCCGGAVGNNVDETSVTLRERIKSESYADGRRVYTPLVGLSLMVFFALACQCMSTLAAVKRETHTWRWPIFLFVYMTALAWGTSFALYQGGRLLGFE